MLEEISIAIALLLAVLVIFVLSKMNGLNKSLNEMKVKVDTSMNNMSVPANTLSQVANGLQQNVGLLNSSITQVSQSIGDIASQAAKIEVLGRKYEETEQLTRSIHRIMVGSYEKGKSGENTLRSMMNELMKIGMVRENVPIGKNFVEYAVIFSDGKKLAIDSKVVSTKDVDSLLDENTPEEERDVLRKKIKNSIAGKVVEVCKYIDPGNSNTQPCAVMAIPDSVVNLTNEVVPEAVKRNVMIAGYSAVPQLIVYFFKIHGYYQITADVAELKEKLASIQQITGKLDDKFFSNRFEKPLNTLTRASSDMRQAVLQIDNTLRLEDKSKLPELTEDEAR